jgi:cyclophilin family peptidyl-prolyl cis-trans isomerase
MRNFLCTFLLGLFMLSGSAVAVAAASPAPQLLLYTNAGMVLLELDHINAPETTAHILGLAEAGLYDGVDIPRVDKGYLIQIGEVWTTTRPRPPELWNSLPPMPLENPHATHARGTISLASAQPGGGGISSFSILTGSRADIDGKYTIFGHVRAGMDVIDGIEAAGVSAKPHIIWAQILPPDLANRLAVALDAAGGRVTDGAAPLNNKLTRALAVLMGSIVLSGLLAALFIKKLSRRHLLAITLLGLLFALISLIVLLQPSGSWAGGAAVLALLLTFRLMSNFENIGREA